MKKVRVYEAAREFKISSEALLEIIKSLDVPVKSHMSSIAEDVVEKIRAKLGPTNPDAAEGGTIRADSAGLGEGATFRVRLPLAAVEENAKRGGRAA